MTRRLHVVFNSYRPVTKHLGQLRNAPHKALLARDWEALLPFPLVGFHPTHRADTVIEAA